MHQKSPKTRIYHQPISAWNMCFCIVVNMRVLLEYTYVNMIWIVYLFFPPTLFERLLFLMWHHGEPPRCSRDWHGLVQELRMTWGLLPPNSRIPGLPIQDSDIFLGLEGLFFGEKIFLNGWFSTQKDRVGESIQGLWNLSVSYKPVIQKHWNTSHIFFAYRMTRKLKWFPRSPVYSKVLGLYIVFTHATLLLDELCRDIR